MTDAIKLRELEEIFHQSLSYAPGDRKQFLDRACHGQAALRVQIDRMLEADAGAIEPYDRIMPEDGREFECGQSIGRWKLIELIGAGGLGLVYRGTCEADGVPLQAAVKILAPGLDARLHHNFIQERRLLAGLDHPYIARLIDAGSGPCGSFLAMEFVEGLPLDAYLEQRQPSLKDRLELFNRICEGGAYLHDNGIVHGDLKPSNVIVRPDGIPKLLDFGTARLMDDLRETRRSFTGLMMTPAYASPEQMAGLGPSARGDVYSLGCVLREMLGNTAISFDLAAIRDKCLAWAVDRRYGSPREIANDIARYLTCVPVSARPASPLYVMRKFLRRNRVACGLAALTAIALLTGWLVARHNALRASQYAEQGRSVITQLVREAPIWRHPESQLRTAYAAGVENAAAQMESMQPPPLGDLTSAWRRVSYSQAARGQTAQSIVSIGRSIQWARAFVKSNGSMDARGQLAESLLYATLLQKRRANLAAAGLHALEAIDLVNRLPDSIRGTIENTPVFVHALLPAARHRMLAGDMAGARALLVRAVVLARIVGKTLQLKVTLDLVQFERAAKEDVRNEGWCTEALSLEISTLRLSRLCGPGGESNSEDQLAALERQSSVVERRLLRDPEHFGDRLRLAQMNLQLAGLVVARGDPVRARERLQRARALIVDLLEGDPENRKLRQLLSRIEQMTMRAARTRHPDIMANVERGSKGMPRAR